MTITPKDPPSQIPFPADTSLGPGSPAVVRATSLERDPLKRNFKNFLWRCWKDLSLPKPTPLQYDMADYLQDGPKKRIIMAFRGAAKSYETVCFCTHALYCNPDEIVLTVSATNKFAGTNAFFAYKMISGFEWLQHMRPRNDQRRSAQGFDVRDATPKKFESFYADSIFGQITGRRASLIVPDDIETPKTSDTEELRGDLLRAAGELGGAILLPEGRIIMLGTAQNENSIYVEFAQNRGYAMRMWPILYPTPEELPKYGAWIAPKIASDLQKNPALAGTSTEPTRFDEADIAGRELEWGRTEFARQFKLWLDAGAASDTPLKLRDLLTVEWGPPAPGQPLKLPPEIRWGPTKENIVTGVPLDARHGDTLHMPAYVTRQEEWLPGSKVVMYIDPAGGGKDETTWPIATELNGVVFLCKVGCSIKGHSEEVLDEIAKDAKLWGVNYIYVESNMGQGMFSQLLRSSLTKAGVLATIEDDRKGVVSKERRIIGALEPVTTAHRLVVNLSLFGPDYAVSYDNVADTKQRFYRWTYQLTRITRTKGCLSHDDRIDGTASLVEKFGDFLKQQTSDAQASGKEEAMRAEVQKIIDTRFAQGLPTYGAVATGEHRGFGRGKGAQPRKLSPLIKRIFHRE